MCVLCISVGGKSRMSNTNIRYFLSYSIKLISIFFWPIFLDITRIWLETNNQLLIVIILNYDAEIYLPHLVQHYPHTWSIWIKRKDWMFTREYSRFPVTMFVHFHRNRIGAAVCVRGWYCILPDGIHVREWQYLLTAIDMFFKRRLQDTNCEKGSVVHGCVEKIEFEVVSK